MGPIDDQFLRLKQVYPGAVIERRGDGSALVKLPEFTLPPGWSKRNTSVLFVIPVGYPLAQPDTFWTDADLRLSHGGFPPNTDLNTRYGGGEQRLWLSYHPTTWHPSRDTLLTWAHLISQRLKSP